MADSLTSRYQSRSGKGDSIRKKALWLSLVQAVAVILFILLSARYVTVLVLSLKEEPVFSAPKTIYLPQRELEHQMAVAEFQNAAATPATIPALTTESLLASLPALTSLPDVEFTPVETEDMVSDSDALFGQSGLMGALGALSSQASSVSFLGITEEASRFVIILDISTTVKNSVENAGTSMEAIRDEAMRLVQSLNANTLFGFIQHSRNYEPLRERLMPATVPNKQSALTYLKTKFRTNGSGSGMSYSRALGNITSVQGHENGIMPILNFAFQMQPDVIFLISDGGYFSDGETWKNKPVPIDEILDLIRSRQKDLPQDARIHAIHFPDPKVRTDGRIGDEMRRIASRNDGKYRKIGR
jgi:hypothetical protein